MAIEPEIMLSTRNMIPTMKDASKRLYPIYSQMTQKSRLVKPSKCAKKIVSSFLAQPSGFLYDRAEKSFEVPKTTLESRKCKNINANVSVRSEHRMSPIVERLRRSREFSRRKRSHELPFPNSIPPVQLTYAKKSADGKKSAGKAGARDFHGTYVGKSGRENPPLAPMPSPCSLHKEEKLTSRLVKGGAPLLRTREEPAKTFCAILELKVEDEKEPRMEEEVLEETRIVEMGRVLERPRAVEDELRSVFSEQIDIFDYENERTTTNLLVGSSRSSTCLPVRQSCDNIVQRVSNAGSRAAEQTIRYSHKKYSWEDIDNWVPPSQRKKDASDAVEKTFECKIKYSWQVIGMSSQTSKVLLDDLLRENERTRENQGNDFPCARKYSWQIIGRSTQAMLDSNDVDYWNGKLLVPNTSEKRDNRAACNFLRRNGKDYVILQEQSVQTVDTKINQTDFTNCQAKYSWENVVMQYL